MFKPIDIFVCVVVGLTLIALMILAYKSMKAEREEAQRRYEYKSKIAKQLAGKFGSYVRWKPYSTIGNNLWTIDFANGAKTYAIAVDDNLNILMYNMNWSVIPDGTRFIGYIREGKIRTDYYIFTDLVIYHSEQCKGYTKQYKELMDLL